MEKMACYDAYLEILKEELIPAMGCTEPIAIALAAARAREALGDVPERCTAVVSGNIIKNAKAVTVPNTGGMKGIEASVAVGVVAGESKLMLEVLSHVTEPQIRETETFLKSCPIHVVPAEGDRLLYIKIQVEAKGHSAYCEIADAHTNIIHVQKDEEVLFSAKEQAAGGTGGAHPDRRLLNVKDIIAFADAVEVEDVKETIERQIAFNSEVARRGLCENWGAGVGKTLIKSGGDGVANRAKAVAAAAADARMGGCSLPVVTVAGSGDQGLAASLPVIEYAKYLGASREELYRALVVSSLTAVHQKTSIGKLSAFCGATSAGCGAAAGIAYLHGGRYEVISHTISNTLAICSGMVCDGAKPACSAKIAAAVGAGLLGWQMYLNEERQFYPGEGLVGEDVEKTIANIGRLAAKGMRETDREILNIMVGR